MMILRSSPPSPFGRKVRIAAAVLGVENEIGLQQADTLDPNDSIRKQNPIGKIPVLLIEDGTVIYDSRVILEYLDHRAGGGRILPQEWGARIEALRLQAICDGILDAAVLLVYEGRWRPPDRQEPKWIAHQSGKIARAMAAIEEAPPRLVGSPTVGEIALACVLGYLDLRFAGKWRREHPRLVAWLDAFAVRIPSYATTAVTA